MKIIKHMNTKIFMTEFQGGVSGPPLTSLKGEGGQKIQGRL